MIRKKFVLLFLIVWALNISVCSGEEGPESSWNLLIITVDTLRADYIKSISPQKGVTHHIDSLAHSGIIFTRAFTHVPLTLPSHVSLMTGTSPLEHNIHDNAGYRLEEKWLTLAELFKKHGYITGAFVGAYPLDRRFGLDQGFDVYHEGYPSKSRLRAFFTERRAESVITDALQWLSTVHTQKWMMWVHLFDPHQPYDPPEPFRSQFEKDPYAGEVAYTDTQIGRLLTYLKKQNLLKKTVVLFVSDHGEALGEHGERTHGYFIYNSTMWIPAILHIPNLPFSRRISTFVAISDFYPTLARLFHFKIPKGVTGRDLRSLWDPSIKGMLIPRPIYIEQLATYLNRDWAPVYGIIWKRMKYIATPIEEFYDLNSDFHEEHNIAHKHHQFKFFKMKFQKMVQLQGIQAPSPESRETQETLRSLGYAGGLHIKRRRTFTTKDDPKTLLPLHRQFQKAIELYEKGHFQASIELFKKVITQRKDMIVAYAYLSEVYRAVQMYPLARTTLFQALKQDPQNPDILSKIGMLEVEMGLLNEGLDHLKKAVKYFPFDADAWNYMGIAYWKKKDFSKALKAFEEARKLDPTDAMVLNNMGNLFFSMGRVKKALDMYSEATQIDPTLAAGWNGMGACELALGNLEKAITYWKKALQVDPNYMFALFNLGTELFKAQRYREAVPYLQAYLEKYGAQLSPDEFLKIDSMLEKARKASR